MRIKWFYEDRIRLREKMLELADKEFYEESIEREDIEMLKMLQELNVDKSTEQNIKNFFEVLDLLVDYANAKGL